MLIKALGESERREGGGGWRWGGEGGKNTQTKNKHVCFYLSNNYLCEYKMSVSERGPCWVMVAEGAETPAEEENKRATPSRWKCFCDICQDVIIAGLAKTAGF